MRVLTYKLNKLNIKKMAKKQNEETFGQAVIYNIHYENRHSNIRTYNTQII